MYARRLVEMLCAELGLRAVSAESLLGHESDRLAIHPYGDVGSPRPAAVFAPAG